MPFLVVDCHADIGRAHELVKLIEGRIFGMNVDGQYHVMFHNRTTGKGIARPEPGTRDRRAFMSELATALENLLRTGRIRLLIRCLQRGEMPTEEELREYS